MTITNIAFTLESGRTQSGRTQSGRTPDNWIIWSNQLSIVGNELNNVSQQTNCSVYQIAAALLVSMLVLPYS
jgi:hypothetical protein